MITLSALVYLPAPVVTAFGVVLIAFHNLLDSVQSANPVWTILHSPNFLVNRPGFVVFLTYPLIPWIGVTAVGYGLGQIYLWSSSRRKSFLWPLGVGSQRCIRDSESHQSLRRSFALEPSERPSDSLHCRS